MTKGLVFLVKKRSKIQGGNPSWIHDYFHACIRSCEMQIRYAPMGRLNTCTAEASLKASCCSLFGPRFILCYGCGINARECDTWRSQRGFLAFYGWYQMKQSAVVSKSLSVL
jgi:hypothetical protein